MAATETPAMSDEYRALLTEREQEILSGDADVSEKYYYRVVTRVRNKIEQLEHDADLLDEHHDTLADELREIVCGGRDILCPICGEEFDNPNNAIHHMGGDTTHDLPKDEIRRRTPDWWSEETPNYYFDE